MARLSETDKAAFRESARWIEGPKERSPHTVEATPEARARYIRWASEATKFYKGKKPVHFTGEHWKL